MARLSFLSLALTGCLRKSEPVEPVPLDPTLDAAAGWAGTWNIVWTRGGGWTPVDFHGRLELAGGPDWTASLGFQETVAAFRLTQASLGADHAQLRFGIGDAADSSAGAFSLDVFREPQGPRCRGVGWSGWLGPVVGGDRPRGSGSGRS